MLSEPQREHVKLVGRTLQIIVGALLAGVITFLAVVLALAAFEPADARPSPPVMTYLGLALAGVGVALWAYVPGLVARRMRQSMISGEPPELAQRFPSAAELGDVGALTAIYQTRTIIAAALLEGFALLSVIVFFLERQPLSLVALGVLMIMLLSEVPTVARLEDWVEDKLAETVQLRRLER
jgi:hypothetical protein